MNDISMYESIPDGNGIDPSLITTAPSRMANVNPLLAEYDLMEYETPVIPTVRSTSGVTFNESFQIRQSPQYVDTSLHLNHALSTYNPPTGSITSPPDNNAFISCSEKQRSYDESVLADANSNVNSYSFPAHVLNTGPHPGRRLDDDSSRAFLPIRNYASSVSLDPIAQSGNEQSHCIQSQFLNKTLGSSASARRPFGPSRTIESLPPRRTGGRRGPMSASELDQRNRAKREGVCIRCRKLNQRASNPGFLGDI
jgi:hypothetical protein